MIEGFRDGSELAGRSRALVDFIERGMLSIDGWGVDPFLAQLFLALDCFQKETGVVGNLMEIGVHHGRSAILLALMATDEERTVVLDLFGRQDENIDASGCGNRAIFEGNLENWAPEQAVEIIEGNSLELDFSSSPGLSAGVRLAHIDGAHYRSAVLSDIAKTRAVLCDGGVVVIDDFMHSGFPGVNEACNAYLEQRDASTLAPVALGHNKLILVTPPLEARLRAHLAERLAPPIGREVTFHNYPVLCLDPH